MSRKYKLVVFVPDIAIEGLKYALFQAGAGVQGDYDSCSWQILGQGQFRPLSGSRPFIGKAGSLEVLDEWRLETLVEEKDLPEVVKALRNNHPYEEPAFDLFEIFDPENIPYGESR